MPPTSDSPARLARLELAPHAPMLRRYLFVLGAAIDRLDDLVQETFMLVLQKGLEDRGPRAVGAFLRGVAKNLLLREGRSRQARREVEGADEVWQRECGDDGDARVEALRACLGELPERSRDLLHRHYANHEGRAEIAAAMAMTPDGVKTALRRLRDGLRACIERRLRRQA